MTKIPLHLETLLFQLREKGYNIAVGGDGMMIMNYKRQSGSYREVRIDLQKKMTEQTEPVRKELISIINIEGPTKKKSKSTD